MSKNLYKVKYCNELVEFMGQGYSIEAFAGSVGVCRDTIYNWRNDHIEFKEAFDEGKAAQLLWHEEQLRIHTAEGSKGNTNALIFSMKNRFRDQWSDSKDIKLDADIKVSSFTDILKSFEDES